MSGQGLSAYELYFALANGNANHGNNPSRAGVPSNTQPRPQYNEDQVRLPQPYLDPFGFSDYQANSLRNPNAQNSRMLPPAWANFGRDVGADQGLTAPVTGAAHQQSAYVGYGHGQDPNMLRPMQHPAHAWTDLGRDVATDSRLDTPVRGAPQQQSAYAGYDTRQANVPATVPSVSQNPAVEPQIEEEGSAASTDDESGSEYSEPNEDEDNATGSEDDQPNHNAENEGPSESDEDGEQIDYGEFEIPEADCKSHGEKPGQVRYVEFDLEWYDPSTQQWRPACIHHNIRKELIERAQVNHPGRSYLFPTNEGPGPHDVTSFHPNYEAWGADRKNWPNILFQFDPPVKDLSKTTAKPGPMMHDGMVVLNHQNNPVLDYDIPATLSSTTPGCFMEAWKRMFPMTHQDLRARMVRFTINARNERQPLSDKNAIINMPMQRFRDEAGCVAWLKRDKKHREGLIKFYNSQGIDVQRTNSTRGLDRVLTKEEQLEVKKGDEAKFPAYNPKVSKTKDVSKDSSANASRKRTRDDEEDSPEETNQKSTEDSRPRKRVRGMDDGTNQNAGDDSAAGPPINLLQRLLANRRAEAGGKRSSRGHTTNGVVHKPAQPLRTQSSHSRQSLGEDEGTKDQTSARNDEDSKASGSDLEEQDQSGSGEDEDIDEDRVESNDDQQTATGQDNVVKNDNVYQYLNNYTDKLDHSHDLENHRRHVREFLNEGPAVEYRDNYPTSAANPPNTQSNQATGVSQATVDAPAAQTSKKRGHSEVDEDEEVDPTARKSRKLNGNANPGSALNGHSTQQRARIAKSSKNTTRNLARTRPTPRIQDNGPRTVKTTAETAEDTQPSIDYRTVAPTTEYECQVLSEALSATREAYFEYTGHLAPTTDRASSYLAQWNTIYDSFKAKFDWSEELDGMPPYIPQLTSWHTSLTDWPPHVKDSLYYGAWKRGVRAPALPNGELIDFDGEFLEQIWRMAEQERERALDDALRAEGYNVDEEVYQEEEL